MGRFIVFEGIEGCGKTTQIKLLGSYLEHKGQQHIVTREPGGTPLGEDIRKIFLHSKNADIDPLTELLLVTASRIQHVKQIIAPALKENRLVLCDRFFDATVAYQGYAAKLSLAMIYKCHELFLDSITPDLTILLDCPVETGLKRSRCRNIAEGIQVEEGRFEEKTMEFHEKVRQGYLNTAKKYPNRFRVIDAGQSVESMHNEICRIITEKENGNAV
jgi:dTMP kinase